MWILRFHLLGSKDYNKISRICKKYGFITRTHSPIVFAKALVKHMTQKTSWRALGREFSLDHAQLYKFYEFTQRTSCTEEIFHVFLVSRSALYVGESRTFDTLLLNNSQEIYDLTQKQFVSMLQGL